MTTTITRRYHFESAHWLPNVPEEHKCHRLHGHNYEAEITVSGPIMKTGFIVDFWDLDELVQPLIDLIDHRTLNDIAAWFLDRLQSQQRTLTISKVRIYETKDCWADCSITGERNEARLSGGANTGSS